MILLIIITIINHLICKHIKHNYWLTYRLLRNPAWLHNSLLRNSAKNGSLIRERLRDELTDGRWADFDAILADLTPDITNSYGYHHQHHQCSL